MHRLLRVLFALLLIASSAAAWATHNRAGEIVYCVDPDNPLLYHVQIITHTKTSAPADRNELYINWGDGTGDTLPRTEILPLPAPFDAQRNLYEGSHLYSGSGEFILSFEDQNRNEGVLNIPNSVNQTFCVKTMLKIGPLTGGNCSVRFLNSPLQDACQFQLWAHNSVAFDQDGDSLSYELLECSGMGCGNIPGYVFPEEVDTNAPDIFQIDATIGTLFWDAPQLMGEYNIAFRVREWRKVFGAWYEVGWVTRDMQITVGSCDNEPPVMDPLPDTCVVAETFLTFDVSASDPDAAQNVTLSALGGPMVLNESPASFLPDPPDNPVSGTFNWQTVCGHVRLQPYTVVFRASDNGQPVILEDYEPVNITVVAPEPENLVASPNVEVIDLTWTPSICTNAAGYRIYRRIGPFPFTPSHCETGVPAYTGYVFLDTVQGAGTASFTDEDVLFGVEYCYRITAFFGDGAESYSSEEACTFLERSVPLITHVSVGATDIANGIDTVRWTNAVELDTVLYPGPYAFQLYRGDGFTNAGALIHTTGTHPFLMHPDTQFVDQPLDTETGPHVYRVELFYNNGVDRVGSSDPASSVFLTASPNDELVNLSWEANTPWTNTDFEIERFDGAIFVQIGTSTEPNYVDTGLVNGEEYCYRVRTIGAYGDPSVVAPLINFSQEACAVPVDLTPPCPPDLSLDNDCEAPLNTLDWTNPNNSCADDTWYYNIWFTDSLGGTFVQIGSNIGDDNTHFEHVDGSSVAGCYVITAIDSVGNESAYSDTLCGDNCPVYTLPNVYTPNNDNTNDFFVPFPYRGVKVIELHIFNRWGQEVFTTDDPAIGWDGTDQKSGEVVSDGVYFYICTVTFDRLAEDEIVQLNGYVHVLRSTSPSLN
ncbi:MAG: gliding motility-associated C-terminal domain-containing protein [Flavobacteriales bacterium]|nr:gliding motility-associated C-terminal domain-containing protein [Flavobacteriales bacterium]